MIHTPQATAKSGNGFFAPKAPIIAMKLMKMAPKNFIIGHMIE